MNPRQLSLLLRGTFLVDAIAFNVGRGLPLKSSELAEAIGELVAQAHDLPENPITSLTAQETPA